MMEAPTQSLCPHCFRPIAALKAVEGANVYLTRTCPDHGPIEKVLIWNNRRIPLHSWMRQRLEGDPNPSGAAAPESATMDADGRGNSHCPFACGLCSRHKQHTCSAIIEVTSRCNLRCPLCFAASPSDRKPDPDLGQIESMLRCVLDSAGPCPLQFSGGEPTLRGDLPQIIRLARAMGFDHIQVNTNGIRLAQDPGCVGALKESGATDFFLQFDGVSDAVYERLRGTALLATKLKAIQACAEHQIAVILVPTLVRGVNDSQIGAIIDFAKPWIPVIKGVHFQPMTYLGRYPDAPRNEHRLLIPDILEAIEIQTGGELAVENFIPPG